MKLKPNQVKAASLLTAGKTARRVAEEVGVTPETISNWRRSAEFEALLNQLRSDLVESARECIRSAAVVAAEGLFELSQGAKSEEVRRKACMDVLGLVGLVDPMAGLWKWGVGPQTAEGIEEERERDRKIKLLGQANSIF